MLSRFGIMRSPVPFCFSTSYLDYLLVGSLSLCLLSPISFPSPVAHRFANHAFLEISRFFRIQEILLVASKRELRPT